MLIQNFVTITILLCIVLGVTIGITMNVIHPDKYTTREIMYVAIPGEVFLRMTKGLALPLIASCTVYSVGSTNIHLLKRIGPQFVIYIIVTKLESAILAACFGMLFRSDKTPETSVALIVNTKTVLTFPDMLLDTLKNMCPKNLLEVMVRHYKTRLVNTHNDTFEDLDKWKILPDNRIINRPNVVGLASLCVVIGLTLNLIEQEGQYTLSLVKCVMKATMTIVMWAMWFAPIGTVFMIAEQIIERKATMQILTDLSTFIAVYFTVLTIQMIVYSLTYLVFVRKNPLKLFCSISESLALTVSTGRDYVGLPYSILYMQKKMHMDNRIVNIVLPMGNFFNKDGTIVFLVLGVMFISELNNVHMGLGKLCYLILVSIMCLMDTSGSSKYSITMLNALLSYCGIPATDVHKFKAVDWICGRYRAVVDVCGDCVALSVLSQINRRLIEEFPETDTPYEEKLT